MQIFINFEVWIDFWSHERPQKIKIEQMSKFVLFDTEEACSNLLPLSFTRPVADFRFGITTLREKWEHYLGGECVCRPVDYLRDKFEEDNNYPSYTYFVASNIIPDEKIAAEILALGEGEALFDEDGIVAFHGSLENFEKERADAKSNISNLRRIKYVFDLFLNNPQAIREDFDRLTKGRESQPLPENNLVVGPYLDEDGKPTIFIEEGATIEGATLNTKDGPIYIGENAQIMEGACVRGPLAIGANSKIRMGAKIYGGCTFGPYCKVGGEVDNIVIFGYSNKAHDGYLGNAVIGQWCNIGAGVNASNLKNDYSKIRVWNYATKTFMRTDLQFCGLIMGDHSKVGINCMFNTASVVGVGCNIHGSGFPRTFIPSFSEGSPTGGFTDVSLKKFYEIAERVMSRRDIPLTDHDRRIYERVYEVAAGLKGRKH